jgi:hypothetical protein
MKNCSSNKHKYERFSSNYFYFIQSYTDQGYKMMNSTRFRTTGINTRAEKRQRIVRNNWKLDKNTTQLILRFLSLRERFVSITRINSMFNATVKHTTENTDIICLKSKWSGLQWIRMFNTVVVRSGIRRAVPSAINCANNVVLDPRNGYYYDTIDFKDIIGKLPAKSMYLYNLRFVNISHLDAPELEHLVITGASHHIDPIEILPFSKLKTLCLSSIYSCYSPEDVSHNKYSLLRRCGMYNVTLFPISYLWCFKDLHELVCSLQVDIPIEQARKAESVVCLILLNDNALPHNFVSLFPNLKVLILRNENAIADVDSIPSHVKKVLVPCESSSRWLKLGKRMEKMEYWAKLNWEFPRNST